MHRKFCFPVIALLLLAVSGLQAQSVVDEIVARVNDSIITHTDIEKGKHEAEEDLRQRFPSDWQSKLNDREKDILRDLIDKQLLIDKAKDLGITGETETIKRLDEIRKNMGLQDMEALEKAAEQQGVSFQDFKEQTRDNIITEKVIGEEVGSKVGSKITKEDVQAWYNDHQKDLATPESVTLAEILVSTQPPKPPEDDKNKNAQAVQLPTDPAKAAEAEAKAKDILDQLHHGASFEDLAKKLSDGPTAAQGGLLGEFKRGEMDKQLEDQTFSLKTGDVSDVIKTRQGYLIFKVVQHQQAGMPPLDSKMEDKIRNVLYVQKLEPAARTYLTKLREESYIEIHEGYVDTGASANEAKPVLIAANTEKDEIPQSKKKKKKHFLVF